MLDQCASAANGEITTDEVCRVLGLAGTRKSAELLLAVSAHDTPQALQIFNTQYAEGKDISAMLDELCTVCRDLLMIRTAPNSVSMISGICTQQELQELLPRFSPGELLRMTSLLRDTVTGFTATANRRIDAELCIIRMCEPEAQLDAQALNARLSRLENKIASGMFAAPQAKAEQPKPIGEETPPWDDDERPPWDDCDAPPVMQEERKPQPKQMPTDFWAKLVERLRTVLLPPARSMFVNNENSPMKGRLDGDQLILEGAEFAMHVVNTPKVLETVSECAGAVLGSSVRVSVVPEGQAATEVESFHRLMEFGEQHPDIVEFK